MKVTYKQTTIEIDNPSKDYIAGIFVIRKLIDSGLSLDVPENEYPINYSVWSSPNVSNNNNYIVIGHKGKSYAVYFSNNEFLRGMARACNIIGINYANIRLLLHLVHDNK